MWRSPSQDLEPSIYHTLKTMLAIDADARFSLDAFVDVHSHSNSRAGFLFMNPLPSSHGSCAPLSEYLYRLPRAMALSVPGFQLSKCCCSTEAFKAACGRRAAGLHLPNTLCYTFEISFFNVVDDPTGNNQRTAKARNSSSSSVCPLTLADPSCLQNFPTFCGVKVSMCGYSCAPYASGKGTRKLCRFHWKYRSGCSNSDGHQLLRDIVWR